VVDSLGDQAAIEAVIVEGRDTMPAYGESLSPDEIAEVTAYIREF
jgi:mono/diheme cytochrome c family protein